VAVHETIISRLKSLVEEASDLRQGHGEYNQTRSDVHIQSCMGWIAAAHHVVALICPPGAPYRASFEKLMPTSSGYTANQYVGKLSEILNRLKADIDIGLLDSLEDEVRAEVFDDFLDHGESYWREQRKNESGVIIGVVFEDVVRQMCKKHGIAEAGEDLDRLISALANKGALSGVKAKRARAAAHVRTKATHAQWAEYELQDVKAALDLTRELIDRTG
jgi:hypothetical protein